MSNFYGSINRLVSISYRKNSQLITVRPNQATTYTAARDVQLPSDDTDHVLLSASSTATLTNKTYDAAGTGNSLSNVGTANLSAAFLLPIAKGGTNSSTALNNNRVIQSSGGALVEAAAITAARALISDANGIPTQSTTTSSELAFVSGVTSAIQTQLDGKQPLDGDLTAIAALSTTGFSARTAANTWALRTLQAGTGISISNPAGVAGDPTISFTGTAVSSFKATWLNATGTTKSITHNLGSTDVIVQVFDIANGQTIEIDTVQRTDSNTVDLTSSEAPGVSWRVLILAI